NGEAHLQLRTWRETAAVNRCSPLLPMMLECSSASHLPARTRAYGWGGESLMLAESARLKREESRKKDRIGTWAEWMAHLAVHPGWPEADRWPDLRAQDGTRFEQLRANRPRGPRKGYVGLVYADGNAMGRLVQELDSIETCQTFSEIVDDSIRLACYRALATVCRPEIEAVRRGGPRPLPADILLLGGGDLLLLLPADLALDFALRVTDEFHDLTREEIAAIPEGPVRAFFEGRVRDGGMTISCGVAFARAGYPFYLLLDLAEELLKNAKLGGSRDPHRGDYHAPTYIDFHLVVGPMSADLRAVRKEDYLAGSVRPRTLRPYSRGELGRVRDCALRLPAARPPRSNLQEWWDAALR